MILENGVCIDHVKKVIVDKYPTLEKALKIDGCFVAGGFLRDAYNHEQPKDVDLFFQSEQALLECLRVFNHTGGYCGNVIDYLEDGINYQLIIKDFKPPIERIEGFDFTCICAAFDGSDFYHHDDFDFACTEAVCEINVLTMPLSSLSRLKSYAIKKWNYQSAYKYILEVMLDKNPNICLLGEYYESQL
jgi:hypothetical protein